MYFVVEYSLSDVFFVEKYELRGLIEKMWKFNDVLMLLMKLFGLWFMVVEKSVFVLINGSVGLGKSYLFVKCVEDVIE